MLGPLADPGIRIVALSTLPVGFCIGAVEVALPAFSDSRGTPALAGILLALWSLASGLGGLAFGARQATRGIVEMYLLIAALFPLACLPLAAANSPLAIAALAMLAGLPIAPLIASRNELVGTIARGGASAESFTWLLTALVTGLALGSAAAGSLAEAEGWRAAVLAGCAVAGAGGALAYLCRGVLRPRAATS
jgi:MFS family permease